MSGPACHIDADEEGDSRTYFQFMRRSAKLEAGKSCSCLSEASDGDCRVQNPIRHSMAWIRILAG